VSRSPLTLIQSAASSARAHTGDMLAPVALLGRGSRRVASLGSARFKALPQERRAPTLVGVGALGVILWFVPFGLLGLGTLLFGAVLWHGRDRTPPPPPAPDPNLRRLDALHRALVPHFAVPEDPEPLYTPSGSATDTFESWEFDEGRQLLRLELRYPDLFTDGEPEDRARVERAIRGKLNAGAGAAAQGREYRFDWDAADNRLTVSSLAPLPADITVQEFVTPPGEIVLGFTDSTATERTIPVRRGGTESQAPPLTWRPGPRSTEPHLLVLGSRGTGKSTLLRAIALQALAHGDLVIVDGAGSGDFACLAGRPGVLAVETTPEGANAILEWAGKETQRRLAAVSRAKHSGQVPPADARRPLWILFDQPSELAEPALADGHPDPQAHLDTPLRHGRSAHLTLVVADDLESYRALSPAVRAHTRARVVLGPADAEQAAEVFGPAAPVDGLSAPRHGGRGTARIGERPLARLQVPAAPDPLDEDVPEEERRAVLAMLPGRAPSDDETPPRGIPAVRMDVDEP
jgi:hypothetical protein